LEKVAGGTAALKYTELTDTQAPTVPTNVQVLAQSQTSIQVTWTASTDNVGVRGYKVYRNGGQVGTVASKI
jgi:chitodextrinase